MSGFSGSPLRCKLLQITRDLTVATGSVAYTGVGFQPTALIVCGTVSGTALTQYITLSGMADNAVSARGIQVLAAQTGLIANIMTFTDSTAANAQSAALTSYDVDGFTLSWTKTGTPTGTATANLLCFR